MRRVPRRRFQALWLVLITAGLLGGATPQLALADAITCVPSAVAVGQSVSCSAVLTPLPSPPNIPAIDWGDRSAPTLGGQGTHVYSSPGTYMVSGELCFAPGTDPCAATFVPAQTTVTVSARPAPALATASPTPAPAGGSSGGLAVQVHTGWNLVSGPTGTILAAVGSLYSIGSGDGAYVSSAGDAPIAGGRGYWAFFPAATTVRLNGAGERRATVQAPAGQWIMIGNPSGVQATTVSGADQVLIWDAVAGGYEAVTQLAPGQGAWAISLNGGVITLTGTGTGTASVRPSPARHL